MATLFPSEPLGKTCANDSILHLRPEPIVPPEIPQPLTRLAPDELLFRDSIREFAAREIGPRVRALDEQAQLPRELID